MIKKLYCWHGFFEKLLTENITRQFVGLCAWRIIDLVGTPRCGVPVRQDGTIHSCERRSAFIPQQKPDHSTLQETGLRPNWGAAEFGACRKQEGKIFYFLANADKESVLAG
jgi:hypothetical protein